MFQTREGRLNWFEKDHNIHGVSECQTTEVGIDVCLQISSNIAWGKANLVIAGNVVAQDSSVGLNNWGYTWVFGHAIEVVGYVRDGE